MILAIETPQLNQEYPQTISFFGRDVELYVTRIRSLQRKSSLGHRVGEGPVHLVSFRSDDPTMNGIICVEKQIYPFSANDHELVAPPKQLEKYNLIRKTGGIVPDWMCASMDGSSLYIHDLSATDSIEVVDINELLSAPPIRDILSKYPWILKKKEIISNQLAQNFAASAKANFVCEADSMFLVNHPKNMIVIADFGHGVVPLSKIGGNPKNSDLLDMNLKRAYNLLDLLNGDFDKLKTLAKQLYAESSDT